MTRNKKIAIGVSGFLALGAISNIGNAHKTEATAPKPVAPITTTTTAIPAPKIAAAKPKIVKPKAKPKHKKAKGCNYYDINSPCAEKVEGDTKSNSDCSTQAAGLAIVAAMSGNVEAAVSAGKIAANTAGTGQKC